MRISDWSSDVCSSDLVAPAGGDAITMLALAAFTVVLAFLYARQIKRTAEVERALAVEREGARTAAESLPARLAEHERDILSAISTPVWRRDATGALRFGNAAAQPLRPALEKASALPERAVKVGRAQSARRHLVAHGHHRQIGRAPWRERGWNYVE